MSSIGRVGRGTVILDCISSVSLTGRQVQFSGALHATTPGNKPTSDQIAALNAERQRLAGYAGNFDEPVVPIIWDLDPNFTGFYRLGEIQISIEPGGLNRGVYNFTIPAEQVVGFAAPQFEAVITGASLTNDHGIVGTAWFTFPTTVTEQFYDHQCTVNEMRVSETGTLNFTTCNNKYTRTQRYYLRPADFYTGTCELKVGPAGTFYADNTDAVEVVVGSQISDSPYNWLIGNGLVRVWPSLTTGLLVVEHYDGSTWNGNAYEIAGDEPANPVSLPAQAGLLDGFETVTVLRNSPEMVAIRLSCAFEYGLELGRVFLDISIRRGDRTAILYLTAAHPDYPNNAWKIRPSVAEASSLVAGGGGIRATANDAGGDRYVLMTPSDFTPNHTLGEIALDVASQTAMFGISMEVGGSAATGTATAAELIEQFHSGQTERLIVASR